MSKNNWKVKLTPLAKQDIKDIFSYVALNLSSPKAAKGILDKFEANFKRVSELPQSCPPVTDEILKSKKYRKLIVDNYVAVYQTLEETNTILFLRVFYGGRDYNSLL